MISSQGVSSSSSSSSCHPLQTSQVADALTFKLRSRVKMRFKLHTYLKEQEGLLSERARVIRSTIEWLSDCKSMWVTQWVSGWAGTIIKQLKAEKESEGKANIIFFVLHILCSESIKWSEWMWHVNVNIASIYGYVDAKHSIYSNLSIYLMHSVYSVHLVYSLCSEYSICNCFNLISNYSSREIITRYTRYTWYTRHTRNTLSTLHALIISIWFRFTQVERLILGILNILDTFDILNIL